MQHYNVLILGAGMTGLAAGWASGLPIYEAAEEPGGICSSYYVRPGDETRLHEAPADGETYRFEIGGGHWIFGGDPAIIRLIQRLAPVKRYRRRSSVYLPDRDCFVPYPLQNHLRHLGPEIAAQALDEMATGLRSQTEVRTLAEWLEKSFGPTLGELFFYPFHELYTAGLYRKIAPQDAYKSPVNLKLAIRGAFADAPPVGYNTTFIYPEEGLNVLAQRLAARCHVQYGKRVVHIDVHAREIHFQDGTAQGYETLISTLPLNRMFAMMDIDVEPQPDPSTAVLVVNIGATKGPRCPEDHWLYIPQSRAGFHRVGFYSNVDPSFLPASRRKRGDAVSIYVEKAYPDGARPSTTEMAAVGEQIVAELQAWGWIEEAEVVDPTWIDVAYTWSWPGSTWKTDALRLLDEHNIVQVGRYARWIFQGIADSLRDGLYVGSALLQYRTG